MNLKRIFGAILTILGTAGLIYVAVAYVNSPDGGNNLKTLMVYGILSLIFFASGISLIRTT
jgi:predicted Na+-dependent transporter